MNHSLAYSVNWEALDAELDSLHPSWGSIFSNDDGDIWKEEFHPADFNQYQRAENRYRQPVTQLTPKEAYEQLSKRPIADSEAIAALLLINFWESAED